MSNPSESAAEPVDIEVCEVQAIGTDRVLYECGHEHVQDFRVVIYGESLRSAGDVDPATFPCGGCALDYFKAHTIRCARCGRAILPDNGVAQYASDPTMNQAWLTKIDEQSVAGCLRTDCCPSGGYFWGKWTGEQLEPRFESGRSVAAEAFATGKPVYISDIR